MPQDILAPNPEKRFSFNLPAILFSILSVCATAQSQSPVPTQGEAKKEFSLEIPLDESNTDIQVDLNDPKSTSHKGSAHGFDLKKAYRNQQPWMDLKEDDLPYLDWQTRAVGVAFSLTNSGVLQSLIRVSQDELLVPNSSEKGFGFKIFMDAPFAFAVRQQGLRIGLGVQRTIVSPDPSLLDSYSRAELEDSAMALLASVIYRLKSDLRIIDGGTFWYGLGAQYGYIFATTRPGSGGTARSAIKSTYGLAPVVSCGADMPLTHDADLSLQVDYHPPWGFTGSLGMRKAF